MTRFITIFCLTAAVLLSGCNLIYKQTIQQGNALEADDLQQLKVGMTKRQVSLILGTPAIHDPFHLNRWDYVYTFRPRGRTGIQRIITLRFDDGQLTAIEGDIDDILLAEGLVDSQEESERELSGATAQANQTAGDPTEVGTAEAPASSATDPEPQTAASLADSALTEAVMVESAIPEPSAEGAVWAVQLGMFEDSDNAATLVNKLLSQDFQAWSEPVVESGGSLTRVLAGKYTDRQAADALRQQISSQLGIDGLLARLPEPMP